MSPRSTLMTPSRSRKRASLLSMRPTVFNCLRSRFVCLYGRRDGRLNGPLHNLLRHVRDDREYEWPRATGFLSEYGWWCKLTGMPPIKVGKLAPVTLGHMRSQGCRDLLVHCNSGRCNHSAIMNVGHLPDDTPIKSLGGIVCTWCGHLGADVVPNWPTHAPPRSS